MLDSDCNLQASESDEFFDAREEPMDRDSTSPVGLPMVGGLRHANAHRGLQEEDGNEEDDDDEIFDRDFKVSQRGMQ